MGGTIVVAPEGIKSGPGSPPPAGVGTVRRMAVEGASYPPPPEAGPERLLAVDLGLKAGLAAFDGDGQLCWARSTRFGTMARLKRALPRLVTPSLDVVVVEGDRQLAVHWGRLADKRGVQLLRVSPEQWRKRLLVPRQRRTGQDAKATAEELAWRLFDTDGATRPPTLRHDAAEAAMIGLWATLELGWREPPAFLNDRG